VLRTTCTALLLVALGGSLAGCTSSSDEPSASRSTSPPATGAGASAGTSAGTSASPAPVAVPRPPPPRACYRLTPAELTRPTSASEPVPCNRAHTSRTVFVGRLDTVVQGHSLAVDSAAVQRQLSTTCPARLAAYVGGSRTTRDLSRFAVVWFSPTLEQSDAGADWFRCDLVAFGTGDGLLALPTRGGVRGVLSRPGGLATYGLCGTKAPGAPGFRRVACARPHTWRAFDTVPLPGGRTYPGAAKVRAGGDDVCKDRARARATDALKFRYGWEWPTRDQWSTGQHFGYCWIPA
jgi:hypothetical protein